MLRICPTAGRRFEGVPLRGTSSDAIGLSRARSGATVFDKDSLRRPTAQVGSNMLFPRFLAAVVNAFLASGAIVAAAQTVTPPSIVLPYSSVNDLVWDGTRSRILVSAGSDVVIVNPETVQVEDKIQIGATAETIAISDDGQYLYAGVSARGVIQRYIVASHAKDLEFSLGTDAANRMLVATSIAVVPGQPQTLVVARAPCYVAAGEDGCAKDVAVFDGGIMRPSVAALPVGSLYARGGLPERPPLHARTARLQAEQPYLRIPRSMIYAWGLNSNFASSSISGLSITAEGVSISWSEPVASEFPTNWTGGYALDRTGLVFDLTARTVTGRAAFPQNLLGPTSSDPGTCALTVDPSGASLFALWRAPGGLNPPVNPPALVQYSLADFRELANINLSTNVLCGYGPALNWGAEASRFPRLMPMGKPTA